MSFAFCVLGSGSAGNSTLVICGQGEQRQCMLVDAGLSPRATARRMAPLGVSLRDISDILLTHLDFDHFCTGWLTIIQQRPIRVHVHRHHRSPAWRAGLTAHHTFLFDGGLTLDCGLRIEPMLLSHDDLGSVGYVISDGGLRLGYATDLGRVPPALLDHFARIDALAIESNYDRQMQLSSGRPVFLKRRIMNGSGHLSNDQALEAVQHLAEGCGLSHVALLHLSRECNDPGLVRDLYVRNAPDLLERLTITSQSQPTALLHVHGKASVVKRRVFDAQHRTPNGSAHQMMLFSPALISLNAGAVPAT